MAHGLLTENGKAAMMYVRQAPWHGLGTRLDSPATSAEAIKAARLDWTVRKVPLYAMNEAGAALVRHRYAVVPAHRWGQEDCPVFGVVGADYVPLQNEEAFTFFDSIVGMKAAMYHTAGALGNGERVWILAKLPGEIRVIGNDISHKYLLLANGHNGCTSVQMKFTTVRVVCQNTLAQALAEDGRIVSVHHGRGFWTRMQDAKTMLGVITDRFDAMATQMKRMAGAALTAAQLQGYLAAVFPNPPRADDERAMRVVLRDRDGAARLFETGPGNEASGVKGTLWAAFNGVTDYVDHVRGKFTAPDRLRSIWFGRGYQIKVRAYGEACNVAATLGK